jgi:MFS family permease
LQFFFSNPITIMSVPSRRIVVPSDPEKGLNELEKIHSHVEEEAQRNYDDSIQSLSRSPSVSRSTTQQDSDAKNKSLGQKLTAVLTTRSNISILDPGPPPDGGAKAWTQAVMGHFVIFNTWGMISAFGVFQSYYTSELGLEPSAVSWIGSIQMLFHFSLGLLSGRALDAGWFYWVIIPGVILSSLGMFMTSLCDQYWQLFLAQGVLMGLGNGLQFTPTTSLVYTYFSKNKAMALAIVASGSATGGLVYPTIARQLLPRLGFAWTTRVMGFLMLAVGACYATLLKPRLPPRKSGPLFELSAFKEVTYTTYIIGVFLTCFGQYFAFYYIGSFARDIIGVPYNTSVNVLLIMNGVGLVGRLISGFIADRVFGLYNSLIPFVFASAIIMFSWAAVKNVTGLYVFAVTYGLFCAGFQGLFPSTLSSLTKDLNRVGVRNGMGFAIVGMGNFLGPPIAGALMQSHGGNYLHAQMWGGSMIVAGGVVLVLGRVSLTGFKLRAKV